MCSAAAAAAATAPSSLGEFCCSRGASAGSVSISFLVSSFFRFLQCFFFGAAVLHFAGPAKNVYVTQIVCSCFAFQFQFQFAFASASVSVPISLSVRICFPTFLHEVFSLMLLLLLLFSF